MEINALDAHCHADLLMHYDPLFIDRYELLKCGGITWSYREDADSWESYPDYWGSLCELCKTFRLRGLPFFYLAGIHPRSIPKDLEGLSRLPSRLLDSLATHLENPLCLGMGELGLDAGTPAEESILRWQLDWALETLPRGKRLGLHTPRQNKERITLQTLALLEEYPALQSRILVDHVTPETWPFLKNKPYMAGMTLQEGKTSLASFMVFIKAHGQDIHRIVLNSDGARSLSSPFLQFLEHVEHLDAASRRALLVENAARFYGLSL